MNVWPDDYIVRLIELPCRVGGMVSQDEEGFYNIYINARLSLAGQKRALKHELDHISGDDLNNAKSIMDIERKR